MPQALGALERRLSLLPPVLVAPVAAPIPVAVPGPAPIIGGAAPAPVAPPPVPPASATSWQRTVRMFDTHRTFFLSLGGASILAFGLLHRLAGAALAGLGFITILPLFAWGGIAFIRRRLT